MERLALEEASLKVEKDDFEGAAVSGGCVAVIEDGEHDGDFRGIATGIGEYRNACAMVKTAC